MKKNIIENEEEQGPKKGIVIMVIAILLGTNMLLLHEWFAPTEQKFAEKARQADFKKNSHTYNVTVNGKTSTVTGVKEVTTNNTVIFRDIDNTELLSISPGLLYTIELVKVKQLSEKK